MGITDWDEWMKMHHIKIHTEEELRRKKMVQTVRKAACFLKKHKAEIIEGMSVRSQHASET